MEFPTVRNKLENWFPKFFSSQPQTYSAVDDDNSSTEEAESQQEKLEEDSRIRRYVNQIGVKLIIALLAFSIIAVGAYAERRISIEKSKQPPCGHSAAEAEALGCKFNLMIFTWTPPDCYDEELVQEFLAEASPKFWWDEEATQEITDFSVLGSAKNLFGTFRFHALHCSYMMKDLQRRLLRKDKVSDMLANEGHIQHCLGVINQRNMTEEYVDKPGVAKIHVNFARSCSYI